MVSGHKRGEDVIKSKKNGIGKKWRFVYSYEISQTSLKKHVFYFFYLLFLGICMILMGLEDSSGGNVCMV